MRTLGIVFGLVTVAALAGCGNDKTMMGDGGNQMPVDASGLSCTYPPGPYGARIGAKLEPFTLPSCADGSDYSFLNEEFCSANLTVISIAAGWCHPCMRESSQMTEQITNMYGPRGVRVIQVLVQDENYRAATLEYCQNWVSTYGLVNTELMDATGVTQVYFPDNSLPSTIIVDHDGVIQFRENGAEDGLTTMRHALDTLLAGM